MGVTSGAIFTIQGICPFANGSPYGCPRGFKGDSLMNLWPELAAASGACFRVCLPQGIDLIQPLNALLCPYCGHLIIVDAMLFDAHLMHVRCGDSTLLWSSAHWGHDMHMELSDFMCPSHPSIHIASLRHAVDVMSDTTGV